MLLLGLALVTSCQKRANERLVVVQERYVHQYGMEIGADEWESRGQSGQVIATLDNGVVVTKEYSAGTLNGETSYTFPHSSLIEHVDTFQEGALVKTIYNDSTGNPKEEVRFSEGNQKIVTNFYESLAPRSREMYRNDCLSRGVYYTRDNKIEATIEGGRGTKILRNENGELVGEAVIDAGKLVKETHFYPNGNPREVISYKNNQVDGTKRTYLINGEPNTIEEWRDGQLQGVTVVFKNGDKYAEIPYVMGKREGVEVRYKDGKTVAEEITWERDKIHGAYHSYFGSSVKTEWYLQGNKVSKASFEQQR